MPACPGSWCRKVSAAPPWLRRGTPRRRRATPLLLLETDCPYLAPIPHRGRRNEVAFVAETARAVADVLGVGVDTVVARTDANARRVLGLEVAA